MKPNKAGVWEWFDEKGNKKFVEVFNVEHDPNYPPYLRVAFWGGYYNVNDEAVGTWEEEFSKAEWTDSWGNYVGPNHCLPEDQIYYLPTQKEYEKIMEEVEDEKRNKEQ